MRGRKMVCGKATRKSKYTSSMVAFASLDVEHNSQIDATVLQLLLFFDATQLHTPIQKCEKDSRDAPHHNGSFSGISRTSFAASINPGWNTWSIIFWVSLPEKATRTLFLSMTIGIRDKPEPKWGYRRMYRLRVRGRRMWLPLLLRWCRCLRPTLLSVACNFASLLRSF